MNRKQYLLRLLAGTVVVALLIMTIAIARGEVVISRVYRVPDGELSLHVDSSAVDVDRGRHVATAIALCGFCHGDDFGGEVVVDHAWVGRIYTANLTKGAGGVGATFDEADWVRAIRFGMRTDGRSLFFMPSQHLSALSDADLASVIAYLRQVPPVATEHPGTRAGWLMRLMVGVGFAPDFLSAAGVDRSRASSQSIDAEPNARYGAYLVDVGNCRFCHRKDLKGGLHPFARTGEPAPPDLTRGGSMQSWSQEDFTIAIRQGRTPDGRRLDEQYMPWPEFSGLSDDEIAAIWSFFRQTDSAGSIVVD